MKVRFYCDVPSNGVRLSGLYPWNLYATTSASSNVATDHTRVAFDVDMPPNLVLPPHDVVAPAEPAKVIEVGDATASRGKHD